MSDRAIYYSNREMIDSFYYWKKQMDPLALELKEYNFYFFLCNIEVRMLIGKGQIEKAMQTANQMYDTAKKYENKDGLIAANLSIGRSLLSARKYAQSILSYEAALALMDKDESRWNAWRMQAYNYLVILCGITGENEKGLILVAEQENLIRSLQKAGVGNKGRTESYMIDIWAQLQLQKASLNLKLHQIDKALTVLNDIEKSYDMVPKKTQMEYHQAWANFYEEVKQYDKALDELNTIYSYCIDKKVIDMSQLMEQKARLLGCLGYKDEAIKLYKEVLVFKDSINNGWFNSQLNELRTIYDTDHLKLKNKELKLKNKQTQLRDNIARLVPFIAVFWYRNLSC